LPEEISRYENLEELLNAIKIFTEAAETNGEPSTLEAYMSNVALLTDQDNEKKEDRDKVTLMTMHSAKDWNSGMCILSEWKIPFSSPCQQAVQRSLRKKGACSMSLLPGQRSRQLSAMRSTGINGEISKGAIPADSFAR